MVSHRWLVVGALGFALGCSTRQGAAERWPSPHDESQRARAPNIARYLQRLDPPPGTRVFQFVFSAYADGDFCYLLVVGDEAVQGLIHGAPRRRKLGPEGLGAVLGTVDDDLIRSIGATAESEVIMDGGFWSIDLRQGSVSGSLDYRCGDCLLPRGTNRGGDFLRGIWPYLECEGRAPPDLAAPPAAE